MHKEHKTTTSAYRSGSDFRKLPPINEHGNVMEIARRFGGEERLIDAVGQLQAMLHAA